MSKRDSIPRARSRDLTGGHRSKLSKAKGLATSAGAPVDCSEPSLLEGVTRGRSESSFAFLAAFLSAFDSFLDFLALGSSVNNVKRSVRKYESLRDSCQSGGAEINSAASVQRCKLKLKNFWVIATTYLRNHQPVCASSSHPSRPFWPPWPQP